jgi:predicted lysophospholipase L1 biosynthesis ABC-type transport system permease subunit
MAERYQHTQRGTLMLVVLILLALIFALMVFVIPNPGRWVFLAPVLGLGILAWLFSSLTVSVGDNELQWRFGPGLLSYRLALADIAGVSIVRNSPLNGFGIRMQPGYRLYNVSGLDAVELQLKSGDIRRIGTDDPSGLAAALRHD